MMVANSPRSRKANGSFSELKDSEPFLLSKPMSTRSRKAKGRIFQNDISSHFRNLCSSNAYYSLHPDRLNLEIKPALMGESGVDIKFTGPSLDLIPFDIECKNHERWNVPKFWDQTLSNCGSDRIPLLCLKRNRSDSLVVLRLVDLYDSRILRFI